MEALRRDEELRFDELSKRKMIEDQKTIEELAGNFEELQEKFNGVNDSRDFKDAESVRSGLLCHVPSAPALFRFPTYPGGLLAALNIRSLTAGTRMVYRETFFVNSPAYSSASCSITLQSSDDTAVGRIPAQQSTGQPVAELSIGTETLFLHRDFHEVRQPEIHSTLWREEISRIMGADQQRLKISELHFDRFPNPQTFSCWKIRFKTEVCSWSHFPTEAMLWIKEVEMAISVDDLKSSRSIQGTFFPDFELLNARIA